LRCDERGYRHAGRIAIGGKAIPLMLPVARDEDHADFGAADGIAVHLFELKIESANVFRLPGRFGDAGVSDMPGKGGAKGDE